MVAFGMECRVLITVGMGSIQSSNPGPIQSDNSISNNQSQNLPQKSPQKSPRKSPPEIFSDPQDRLKNECDSTSHTNLDHNSDEKIEMHPNWDSFIFCGLTRILADGIFFN